MARRSGWRKVNKTRRLLRRLPKEMQAEVRGEMQAGADAILGDAKANVPTRTGRLRANLSAKASRDGLSAKIGIRGKRAGRRAFYGMFVEFGTVKMPARPFLQPAFEANRKRVSAGVRKALQSVLARAGRT